MHILIIQHIRILINLRNDLNKQYEHNIFVIISYTQSCPNILQTLSNIDSAI